MRELILISSALLIGAGFATAQQRPQAPETTGQAATFEERWIGERPSAGASARPDAASPATTGQAPRHEEVPADSGNSNWSPPPVTAPTTQR
jgi:hypothetical protein